ncbi:MAG: ECF transporter S component, partial [Lachnospiraceae bacterium]|nr:ECF transporter S component [Lachnospiraceae bacterium]
MKKNYDLLTLVQLAMLICIQLVMKAIGLGSVPVGPLYMSFLTLPIAVAAIIIGPAGGAITGAVFGLVSFKDALTGGSVMTSTLLGV